ncbi:MAG: hypothetical protein ACRERR_15085 [Moraxellaceae bacterium]
MSEPIEQKIQGRLKKNGFPLEMAVASVAKATGFDVSQSDYYIDHDTNEPREIDLILSANKFIDGFNVSYNLLIECKSSKEKPWIIFGEKNLGHQKNNNDIANIFHLHSSHITNDLGDTLLMQTVYGQDVGRIYPRINSEGHIGHGMAQAFSEACDAPFKAMMSASKAALYKTSRDSALVLSVPIILSIPVIVIDVPLFLASFSETSKDVELSEIKRGVIHWKHVVGGRSRIGIYIVTKDELSSFLHDCFESAKWWINTDTETLMAIRNSKRSPDEVKRSPG